MKRISVILIIISVALLIYIALEGIKIGNFQILSVEQLSQKNKDLGEKIDEASKLTSIDFPEEVKILDDTFEKYKIQKQKYDELTDVIGGGQKDRYETKQYDMGYLWRILGQYAEKRELVLEIEGGKEKNTNSLYYFNFNVSGDYTDVILFMKDIENDSDLYFRIYNFKMVGKQANGRTITEASFSVRNINISSSTLS